MSNEGLSHQRSAAYRGASASSGAVSYSGFYNAGGWGPAIIANFPPAIWFLVASISMIRKREAVLSPSAYSVPVTGQ